MGIYGNTRQKSYMYLLDVIFVKRLRRCLIFFNKKPDKF